MEMKEVERVVVAKPIVSRPAPSFKSFSELLGGAFDASSNSNTSETAVAAIRPKTVRLSSMTNRASPNFISSQAEIFETAPTSMSSKIPVPESRGSEFVVHKPSAKPVSKNTISLLVNMDNLSISHQLSQGPTEACAKHSIQEKCIVGTQASSLQQRVTSHKRSNQAVMPDVAMQNMVENVKPPPSSNSDRPSYDGYNWRKYGQKQVKGSEYPRSYYKCTHPSCPVKKKVERSFDGQIAEIVYKGEHNHAKRQPPTRNSSATDGAGTVSDGVDQYTNNSLGTNDVCERTDGSEGREETGNEKASIFHCTYRYNYPYPLHYDPLPALSGIGGAETSQNTCGLSGECEEGSNNFDAVGDEPESKRRKSKYQFSDARLPSDVLLEVSTMVQSSADSELLEDGFRWRKYGQKVVKGNPYPRSYYRCTNIKCSARKHVERSADDPQAFVTTYEGKHNHEMLHRSNSAVASGSDLQGLSKDKP